MTLELVHVTVGTTKFDALINKITSNDVLSVLKSRGCRKLILQTGNSKCPIDVEKIRTQYHIEVERYDFKFESTRTDVIKSDLIIGHAGAGTCMDILNHQKHGLIVVNEELMDNHQTELALQLADEGYLYYCRVSELAEKLETLDFNALNPYEPSDNMNNFVEFLNEMMSIH